MNTDSTEIVKFEGECFCGNPKTDGEQFCGAECEEIAEEVKLYCEQAHTHTKRCLQ